MRWAIARTGEKPLSPECSWCNVSFFFPFFWLPTLMVTASAESRTLSGESLSRTLWFFHNLMSCFRKGIVSRVPEEGVYSPTLRRKKKAVVTK